MTNDERDVLHHIQKAEDHIDNSALKGKWIVFHIGTAITLSILEVARAIREFTHANRS